MSAREAMLRAPLVPVAVLVVAGILTDRYLTIPGAVWPAVAAVGVLIAVASRQFAVLGLGIGIAGLAALQHHVHLHVFPTDDIGNLVTDEPRLGRLRGKLVEDAKVDRPVAGDPLRSVPEVARIRAVVDVEAMNGTRASGRAAVTLHGTSAALRAGEVVEFTGQLRAPRPPDNPGERDRRSELLDQRIRADFVVRHVRDAEATATQSGPDPLASVRVWAQRHFVETLAPEQAGVASALLLGDGAAMDRADWQRYIRTGVVHVLAVSGQHLAVLATFVGLICRGLGRSRRQSAIVVLTFVIGYSALTGARPSVLRATLMVVAVGVALWLRRPVKPGNTLTLAAIAVLLANPTDIADPGCQFSFLCVAILIWGFARRDSQDQDDPLRAVIDASRPWPVRWLCRATRAVAMAYLLALVLGLAVMPLTAAHYNLISPVGIVIGPPALALASVALVAGVVQLALAAVLPPAALIVAPITQGSLAGLTALVEWADRVPGAHIYLGAPPLMWLLGFYMLIGLALWYPPAVCRLRWCLLAAFVWGVIGLAATLHRDPPSGLVVTFLAVGHGGATVLELPDGRVMLCDCGAMSGPDVTRRVIAPFLWHRGIRKIDDVIITHADLDHFNGLPGLVERFTVGRVHTNPSFATKLTPGVGEVLAGLDRAGIAVHSLSAGDRLEAGDTSIEVAHPPPLGPSGPENARSLVVLVQYVGHCIALTGDVDLAGRERLLQLPRPNVDVWLAPHHAGRTANPPELAIWARPAIVVAHNGQGEGGDADRVYREAGAEFFGTWPHGAVTVLVEATSLQISTFRSRRRLNLP